MSFLYWVYDNTCGCEKTSGYVGVTEDPVKRLQNHRNSGRVPRDVQQIILFEGTREECVKREHKLRPSPNIGWNRKSGRAGLEQEFHRQLVALEPVIDDLAERIHRLPGVR